MNNRNFFLFSLLSLFTISCSAMEIQDFSQSGYNLESSLSESITQPNKEDFKENFKVLTTLALNTTQELHDLLKNKNTNLGKIKDLTDTLNLTTGNIQRILTTISIHEQDSTRAANLIFSSPENITEDFLTNYKQTILEIRLVSLQSNSSELMNNSRVFYDPLNQTTMLRDNASQQQQDLRVNFFTQLQQLRAKKQISIKALQKCQESAQACLEKAPDLDETL